MINYRFQGLAKKIPETHQTVLANGSNLGVRSAKSFRMDLVVKF
jgi:hypothetical protein